MIVIITTSATLLQINRFLSFDIGLFRLIDLSSGELLLKIIFSTRFRQARDDRVSSIAE